MALFSQSINIDCVEITVKAEKGVFPQGAVLRVANLSITENGSIKENKDIQVFHMNDTLSNAEKIESILDDKGNIIIGDSTISGFDVSENEITTSSSNGYIITRENILSSVSKYTIAVTNGTHNIVLKDASLYLGSDITKSPFSISSVAKVNLVLEESNYLRATCDLNPAGLHVPEGAELVIAKESKGSISAFGGPGAGIGGGGNITINGGVVNTTGNYGSGIGGSSGGSLSSGGNFVHVTANSVNADISSFKGIIKNDGNTTIYGTYTLTEDMTIIAGKTMTISYGSSVIVPNDKILTVNGTLINNGILSLGAEHCLTGTEDILSGNGTFKTMGYKLDIAKEILTGNITITGKNEVGSALMISLPTNIGISDSDYEIQWYYDNTAITGANAQSYTIVKEDLGRSLKVTITAKEASESFTGKLTSNVFSVPAIAPEKAMVSASAENSYITLNWTKPYANGSDIIGYSLTVKQGDTQIEGSPFTIGADATSYKVEKLTNGTEYTFILSTINGVGSTTSDSFMAKPQNKTDGGSSSSGSSGGGSSSKDEKDDKEPTKAPVNQTPPAQAELPLQTSEQDSTNAPVFTDTENHWAKSDIDFVVQRGLFGGTGDGNFSPNMPMTRGMFVTVLGKLAKADLTGFDSTDFKDVKSDAYYLPYIQWANTSGIVNGISSEEFAPDMEISREQMAVMLLNYIKAMNIDLAKLNEENQFADTDEMSTWAKEAVKAIQMSGILSGKPDNKFDPKGIATRAEVSSMLRRFIELIEGI